MFPHSKPKDGVVSIQPAARLSKSWWRPTSLQLDNDPPKLFSPSPQLATEPDRLDSDHQRQGVRQDGSQPALADERWTIFTEHFQSETWTSPWSQPADPLTLLTMVETVLERSQHITGFSPEAQVGRSFTNFIIWYFRFAIRTFIRFINWITFRI